MNKIDINKIDSSETTRKNTFNFNNYIKKFFSNTKNVNIPFFEWFVGFTEGDGSFSINSKNNRLFFVINQKEKEILDFICTNLGFGKVYTYKNYSRFIVADKKNIDKLIFFFNGNLVLNKTNERFISWLRGRNTYSLKKILYLGKNVYSTIENNCWLSGFIDAEGCFNVGQKKNPKYKTSFSITLRFLLDQKNEKCIFEKIALFLQSGPKCIQKRLERENMFRFAVSNKKSLEILINYLKTYPLHTSKKNIYYKFCTIFYFLIDKNNYPLIKENILEIENLIKNKV